jgi:predicted nucleotidyltransferase
MVLNNIHFNSDKIAFFCKRYGIKQLALFGSILSQNFTNKSDIDIMITFLPQSNCSYFDLLDIKAELEQLTGRKVDVIEKDSITNPYRKKSIFENLRVIYDS